MASSKQLVNSLLTEHFRYTPLTLVDEIINVVNEVIYKAVTGIEDGLTGASPALLGFEARAAAEKRVPDKDQTGQSVYPEVLVEIEEGVHKLETLLGATVDRNFDKTEIYILRNILSVPEDLLPWMRLGHYEGLDFSPSPNAPTLDSLFALRRKAHEVQRLHQALAHESSRNAAVLAQLHSILHGPAQQHHPRGQTNPASQNPDLSFLAATPAAKSLGVAYTNTTPPPSADGADYPRAPLTQHTARALADLPALKALLAQLKPALAAAPALPPSSGAAEERREYIEAQARRVLERQGVNVETGDGLVGPSGGVKGELGMGRDEVDAIEGVAAGLDWAEEMEE